MVSAVKDAFRVKKDNKVTIPPEQTSEGHEVLKLIVLTMREEIRSRFYANRAEITWSQVEEHIRANTEVLKSDFARRVSNNGTSIISNDTLYDIENGKLRTRSMPLLEVIGRYTTNPLTDQPFTWVEMAAIIRSDREVFPQFDELAEALREKVGGGDKMPKSGTQVLGRLVKDSREALGISQEDFEEYLLETYGDDVLQPGDIAKLENATADYKAPTSLIVALQASKKVIDPRTGKAFGNGELGKVAKGVINPFQKSR